MYIYMYMDLYRDIPCSSQNLTLCRSHYVKEP